MDKTKDCKFNSALPKHKAYKINDDNGLYLHVLPTGTKVWRFNYRKGGKYQTATIGRFDVFSVEQARYKAKALKVEILKEKQGIKDSSANLLSEHEKLLVEAIAEKLYQKIGARLAALEESLFLINEGEELF